VAAGIDPVDLVAILQEFEGLQNNLGLPGVIAEASMFRSQIVFETQTKLWGEVLFRSPKDIQVYPPSLSPGGITVAGPPPCGCR
jgi:hypothetical protein